jgi:hypothetical protein
MLKHIALPPAFVFPARTLCGKTLKRRGRIRIGLACAACQVEGIRLLNESGASL